MSASKASKGSSKEKKGKPPHLKKVAWYKMFRFFDEPGEKIAEIQDCDVICQGRIYEGKLTCKCGHVHELERLMVKGDPRLELNGESEGGKIQLQPVLAVCMVPPEAISNNQGKQLELMLNANLRCASLVITNNVQLAQLKEISEATAKKIMLSDPKKNDQEVIADEKGAKIVEFDRGKTKEEAKGSE